MAYVEGESLQQRLRRSALARDDALRLVADLAAGLDALHARRLIHRDVKPSNVLLTRQGHGLLTDFGLARGPAHTVLTKPGQIVGTPHYLAPEIIRGDPASPASDIYALGCLTHAALHGRPPFNSVNVFEVMVAHFELDPPRLAGRVEGVSPLLDAAIRAALAKDPAKRPRSGQEAAELTRFRSGRRAAWAMRRPLRATRCSE